MAGVDASGFTAKTYNEIIADMQNRAKNEYGLDIDLSDTSPLSEFLRSIAQEEALLWQVLEDVYYSAYIDFATGVNLDRVAALLGVTRKPATKATGTVTFSRSTPASSDIYIPLGTRVSTSGDNPIIFETTQGVTLTAGSTSVDAPIQAVEAGTAGNVAANTITVIVDPISGIESVNNSSPTTGGADTESDASLRLRAKQAVEGFGGGTVAAIESAIKAVDGVIDALVTEDTTNHTVTAIVEGGADADIDAAIEDTRPAGIQVTWQRPTYVDIYVDVQVTQESGAPSTVLSDVQQAVIDYISSLGIGDDVIYNKVIDAVMSVEGVADAVVKIDTTSPPAGTSNIAIASTEKARTDSTKVSVA